MVEHTEHKADLDHEGQDEGDQTEDARNRSGERPQAVQVRRQRKARSPAPLTVGSARLYLSCQASGGKILKSRGGYHVAVLCDYIEQAAVNRFTEEEDG